MPRRFVIAYGLCRGTIYSDSQNGKFQRCSEVINFL